MKYESILKNDEKEKKRSEFDLRVFLRMRDISLNEISYQIKKNILIIILVSIIFFIVASKAIDSISFNDNRVQRKRTNVNDQPDDNELNEVKVKNGRRQREKRENKQKIVE